MKKQYLNLIIKGEQRGANSKYSWESITINMPSTTFKCAEKQNLAETNDRYALICTDLPEEKHADFYYSNCCQNIGKSWRREDTCKSVASIGYLGNEAEFYEWMSSKYHYNFRYY